MITTSKQRRQAQVFLDFVDDLYIKSKPASRRAHWGVAYVQGRLVIFYDHGDLQLNLGDPFKSLIDTLFDAVDARRDVLIKAGIRPIIMNVVFPSQLGRTVSCEFIVDEPSILNETLKATQHNLMAVACAEGLLPLSSFVDIIKKAIPTAEWARPFRI